MDSTETTSYSYVVEARRPGHPWVSTANLGPHESMAVEMWPTWVADKDTAGNDTEYQLVEVTTVTRRRVMRTTQAYPPHVDYMPGQDVQYRYPFDEAHHYRTGWHDGTFLRWSGERPGLAVVAPDGKGEPGVVDAADLRPRPLGV